MMYFENKEKILNREQELVGRISSKMVNKQIYRMIQCEKQEVDIYQVLSFCLAFFKRKILLLLKIFFNQKSQLSKPQLLTQLAKQQLSAQSYIQLVGTTALRIIEKDEQMLFNRFVYRIKDLIRNYYPIANNFQQVSIYLKKIETYSFKHNYKFQEFLLYILQRNPSELQKTLSSKLQEVINCQSYTPSNPLKFILSHQRHKTPNNDIEAYFFTENNSLNEQHLIQSLSNQQGNKDQRQLRPIDVFNNSIAAIQNCLNCDVTYVRGIYFNLQKQKETFPSVPNLHHLSNSFNLQTPSITHKTLQQIQEEMLASNQSIKDSIKSFDRQYSKYQTRILRCQTKIKKQHTRCQTAKPTRRQFNYTSNHPQTKKKRPIISEYKKKIDANTISNNPSIDQKKLLPKQLPNKRQSILKMKSISVSVYKGHLQLCSQKKQHCKKMSLTFANFKYGRKNTGNNLKKKYESFMNTCLQSTIKNSRVQNNQSTYQPPLEEQNYLRNEKTSFEDWNFRTIEMGSNEGIKLRKRQQSRQYQIVSIKGVQALIFKDKESQKYQSSFSSQNKNQTSLKNQSLAMVRKKKEAQSPQTFNDLENTIKSFMKGINVSHRNFNNTQYKSKRLFDTINPELYIKTIKKL